VAQQLNGHVSFRFDPEGLVCEFDIDLQAHDQGTAAAAE
jgi:hypothetical protein